MKHKRLSALLTAGLMLTTLPALPQNTPLLQRPVLVADAATSGTCGENVTWKLKDGVLTISGTGAIKDYTLDERPFSGLSFSKAVISDGVTSIGDYTFMRCFGVKSITIPSSVKRFGNQAFYQCTALTDLTIPSSVTDIGLDVFNETPWLETKQQENPLVIVNSILVDGRTCTGEVTIPDGVTRIGEYAFYLCKTMTGIQFPASVTSIAGGAFSGCWELKSVTIPDGVTAIEGAAFARCYALTSVKIPNNVTSIGASAFLSCNSLTEIKIPYSVTSISDTAFEDCKKLTIKGYTGTIAETFAEENDIPFTSLGNVPQPVVQSGNCGGNLTWTLDSSGTLKISGTGEMDDFDGGIPVWDSFQSNIRKVIIEDGVTSIGAYAFNGYEELQDISIPDSVQRFGIHAFSNTAWLAAMQDETPIVIVNHILISGNKSNEKELTVPDGVTFINDSAFRRSQELKKIVLPDSVTGIGQDAFYNCYALESVTLSERLTEIGDSAFRMCYALKDLVIPDGVTNIPQRAFMECTALESITIPASVTFIENDAFSDCSALTIKGYSGSYAESYAAENNIPFESLGEAPEVLLSGTCGENLIWELKDGVLTISGTGKMTNYTPENSPFSGLSFSKAVISDGVTSIGNYAFASCSVLKELCIPESVTLIGSEAFADCTALTEVIIPDSVTEIWTAAFGGCSSLTSVKLPDSLTEISPFIFESCPITEIALPSEANYIGDGAFEDCKLTSISIPSKVSSIGAWAFCGCPLTEVTVPENVEEIKHDAFNCTALSDITILNPACILFDDVNTIYSSATIHGFAGSTAEEYANKYGCTFESLDDAPENPVSEWAEQSVISKTTKEAELVVRVGDIDACNDENAVADHGYDPFTAKSQYAHGYPWLKDETDPAGTDRIFVGSKWNGEATDGYASNYAEYKNGNDEENAFGEGALSITMEYDASEIDIKKVILQLCIDDFQALSWDSDFTVTLNGKDAPFIAELLNHTDQTGPTAYIVSAVIPSGFFADIASGKLTVVIDETTGVGDGYAIDFARLLINYDEQIFTGTFSGKTEPGATVRLLGTSTTVTAASNGFFSFNAIPGINAVRASKNGFVEKYDSGIVLSVGTEWKPELLLEEGKGSPDIDFSKFAETGKPMKGDYNADGEITVADAVLLARFLAEDTELYAEQIAEILNHEPDFDDDGLLTILDLKALLNQLQPAQKPEVFINEINVPDAVINDDRFESDGKWYDISSPAYDGLPLSGDVFLTAPIPGEIDPENLGSYVFVYYDETNDECRYLFPDSYDLTAGTMTIDLPHFSFWGTEKLTKEAEIEAFLNSYSTKLAVERGNSQKAASELEPYVRAKAEAMGLTKQATEDLIQSTLNFLGGRFTGKNKAFIETGTKYTTTLTRGFFDNDGEAAMNGLEDAITDALMNSWDELEFSDRLDEVLGSEFAGSTTAKLLSSSNGIARMAGYMAGGEIKEAMKELGSVMQGIHPAVELGTKAIAYLGAKVNEEFTNWKSNQIEELYQIYKNGLEDIWGNEVIPCNRDSFLTYLNTSSGFTKAKGVARFYNLDKVGEICEQFGWEYRTYEELPPRYLEKFQQRAENGLMEYFELRLKQEKIAEEIKKTERACIETMMNSAYGALDPSNFGKFFDEKSPDDYNLTARLERLVNVRSFVSQYVDEDKLAEAAKVDNSYNYGDILNWWVDLASNNEKSVAIQKFREELRTHGFLKEYTDQKVTSLIYEKTVDDDGQSLPKWTTYCEYKVVYKEKKEKKDAEGNDVIVWEDQTTKKGTYVHPDYRSKVWGLLKSAEISVTANGKISCSNDGIKVEGDFDSITKTGLGTLSIHTKYSYDNNQEDWIRACISEGHIPNPNPDYYVNVTIDLTLDLEIKPNSDEPGVLFVLNGGGTVSFSGEVYDTISGIKLDGLQLFEDETGIITSTKPFSGSYPVTYENVQYLYLLK